MCGPAILAPTVWPVSSRFGPRRTALAFAIGIGLVASACGGGSEVVEAASSPAEAEQLTDKLFVDEFSTIDDATFDLASLQGEDAVLWFWAPW